MGTGAIWVVLMLVTHIWNYIASALACESAAKSCRNLSFIISLICGDPHGCDVPNLLEDRVDIRKFFRPRHPILPELVFETLGALGAKRNLCTYGVALDDFIATNLSNTGAQFEISVVLPLIAATASRIVGSEIVMIVR